MLLHYTTECARKFSTVRTNYSVTPINPNEYSLCKKSKCTRNRKYNALLYEHGGRESDRSDRSERSESEREEKNTFALD